MDSIERRRSYMPPALTQYGKLESLTGALVCTGLSNKVGPLSDDVTPYIQALVGDEKCV